MNEPNPLILIPADDKLKLWLTAWVNRSESKHTRKAYESDVSQLIEWLGNPQHLLTLTPPEALAYIKHLRSCPGTPPRGYNQPERAVVKASDKGAGVHYSLSASSINRKLASLRSLYAYLVALPDCPVRFSPFNSNLVPNPKGKERQRQPTEALTADEVRVLFANCDMRSAIGKRDAAMLACLFHAGMRVSEVVALDMDSVRFEGKFPHLFLPESKGKGACTQAISPRGVELVGRYWKFRKRNGAKPDSPLFVARMANGPLTDRRLSSDSLRSLVRRMGVRAGLPKPISSHTGRATAITQLLLRKEDGGCGYSPQEVIRFSRHADIRTVMKYWKLIYGEEGNPGYGLRY